METKSLVRNLIFAKLNMFCLFQCLFLSLFILAPCSCSPPQLPTFPRRETVLGAAILARSSALRQSFLDVEILGGTRCFRESKIGFPNNFTGTLLNERPERTNIMQLLKSSTEFSVLVKALTLTN